MAKVRLTQLDGKLPNLALMRLAAFHEARGDSVHFSTDPTGGMFEPEYETVYGSAIFSKSKPLVEQMRRAFPNAIIGGTWEKGEGVPKVEQIVGDFPGISYAYWPDFTASIGFTQRGCRFSCKFCGVPEKEGAAHSVATIADIWRGPGYPKKLHLLDNDFFGNPEWRERIKEIRDGGFKVCFSQGINVRILTNEIARELATVEYRDADFQRRRLYTAWDNIGHERSFFRGVQRLSDAGIPPDHLMVYMLIGWDTEETWHRIFERFEKMTALGIRPYPMVYEEDGPKPELKRFQRWVIRREYLWKPWADYTTKRQPGVSQLAQDLFA